MLQFRLRAYEHFLKRPMPVWTDGLDQIDFDKIVYYRKPSEREEKSWDDVPEQIKADVRAAGHPRGGAQVPRRRRRAVRLRGRLPLASARS